MNLKLTSLIIASSLSISAFAQTDLRSDLQKMQLKGQVRSITEAVDGAQTSSYIFNDMGYIASDGQQYSFDANGHLLMSADKDGRSYFEYSKGNLIEYSKGSYKESYIYNDKNQMISCNTPKTSISFAYDANGNLISKKDVFGNVIAQYTYDAKNNLSTETGSDYKASFKYDSNGNVIAKSLENKAQSVDEQWFYDADDLVVKYVVTTKAGNSKTTETHSYENDVTGNWVKDNVLVDNNGTVSNKTITRDIQYLGAARQLYLIK